ncbi:MAG: glutamate--tRNA ligase, partial [Gammaproteobacteria bacterium]|nr:glutamate--tRNA ligase [Gammaproteobacteria bacterium]
MTVITRFPPSPTGDLHIGGARTALFCWLLARKQRGKLILRIEDTDRLRSTEESVQTILDAMDWLELDYDEGPYFQTERMDRYREVVAQLVASGNAYHCYCSRAELDEMREEQRAKGLKPRYDGRCRGRTGPRAGVTPVVRFKNPRTGSVHINDLVKGRITIANDELDDLIIARSDGTPTYNLTVVVDDMDMGITHVVRGDDHVNNTPRQINILSALGAKLPAYAHVPMILGADGKRMSKRHGAVGVMEYRKDGYLPDALLNYLVRLGWSHGDQEIFSREQMIDLFALDDVHKGAAVFDPDKLLWINYEYVKTCDIDRLLDLARPYFADVGIDLDAHDNARAVVEVNRERSKTLLELVARSRFFFTPVDEYEAGAVKKHFKGNAHALLRDLQQRLEELPEWNAGVLHDCVHTLAAGHDVGLGKIAQPLRVALAGVAVSPPIDETLALLGRDETLIRIEAAVRYLA